jgi:hypothetical protein
MIYYDHIKVDVQYNGFHYYFVYTMSYYLLLIYIYQHMGGSGIMCSQSLRKA